MSRYTLPLIDVGGTNRTMAGTYIAYGFDHILGPFFDLFLDDELVEEISYFFNRSFDCHALALQLAALTDARAIHDIGRTRAQIMNLMLDLPI